MSQILVTGGCGFVGHHLANRLNGKHDVTVYDNLSTGKKERLDEGIGFIEGDVTDTPRMIDAMEDCDLVYHLAAFVSVRESFAKAHEELNTNCRGTLNVLTAANQQGVRKIVQASSMAVYGYPLELPMTEETQTNPVSPYGMSKLRGELYADMFKDLPVTSLRYANIYGSGQTPNPYTGVITVFINNLLKNEPMTIHGNGLQTRDFIWVEDIVDATILSMKKKADKVYCVGTGKPYAIVELAKTLKGLLGGKMVHGDRALGDPDRAYYDISKIKRDLRFKPKGVVAEVLPDIIEHLKNA